LISIEFDDKEKLMGVGVDEDKFEYLFIDV
jgi:hypothetical protein